MRKQLKNRISIVLMSVPLLFGAMSSYGEEDLELILEPNIKRADIIENGIDDENFEIGFYFGPMVIEDFGADFVKGAKLAYHFSEDIFIQASVGSAKGGRTSFEYLSGSTELFTDDERTLDYYSLSIGYNFLQGESFFGKRAINSAYYLIVGAGNSNFANDNHFTVNYGIGFRFYLTDWLNVTTEMQDHTFNFDALGIEKATHNLEMVFGLNVFF